MHKSSKLQKRLSTTASVVQNSCLTEEDKMITISSTPSPQTKCRFSDNVWQKGKPIFKILLTYKGSIKFRFSCSIHPKIISKLRFPAILEFHLSKSFSFSPVMMGP